MEDTILIGVGSTEAQMLAVNVLSYTLHKHTKRPLEIVPLYDCGISIPAPKDPRNTPRTPFSFQRFLLPELGNFERRTIYVDSDMIVFSDIGDLFDTEMGDADALACMATPGRKVVYSVLLISKDCPWKINDIVGKLDNKELSYQDLMFKFRAPGNIEARLPYQWNSCEIYKDGDTSLLHYTDMRFQPWLVTTNPLAGIWIGELFGAIEAGYVSVDSVAKGVKKRWVRPSLLYQVENGVIDPREIPFRVRLMDIPFTLYSNRNKLRIF